MDNRFLILLVMVSLSACDEDTEHADTAGGGPGSSDANNVVATSNGFCDPTGGTQSLGSPSYSTNGPVTARIDNDGDPNITTAIDPDHQNQTSGTVNGQFVNAAQYNYIVLNAQAARNAGVSLGDWASVTNTATGQTTYARYEDAGPSIGEISEATASSIGIQYTSNSFTVGDPQIVVQAYGGTASIAGDCQTQSTAQN